MLLSSLADKLREPFDPALLSTLDSVTSSPVQEQPMDYFLGAGVAVTMLSGSFLKGKKSLMAPLLGMVVSSANKFYKLQFDTHYAYLEFLGDLLRDGMLIAFAYGVGYSLGAFFRYIERD